MPATILVVEDEPAIQELIAAALQHAGHRVVRAFSAEEAATLVNGTLPDMALIDWMLPGMSGIQYARRLRGDERTRDLPIILLTARGEEQDKVAGLEAGADDYLTKPFSPRELVARIKAVLRRQAPVVPGAPTSADETVSFGDYVLFLATRELKKGDEVHMLTTGEFAVLKALVQHAREPLTRDKLMNLARGREWDALERSIDVQISRLRRLIEPDPSKPRYIQTVWGVGYVFVPDGAKS